MTDPRVPEKLHPSSRCRNCDGEGVVRATTSVHSAGDAGDVVVCSDCDGTGERKLA